MTINLTALQKQRYDTAANWTGANPTLLAGEIGIESDTLRWKVGNGSTAWTSLAYIPGLTYGTARQLLQTNSGATGAEWTSNVDIPGTLDVTGTSTLDGMVLIGTTTSIGGGKFQVSSDTATTLQNFSFNSSANSNTASLQFVRARGTKASPSIVLNDDYIGEIRFIGYGTTYNTGASIRAIVDGDPATSGDSSDMPTKLVFLTSPNGSATPDTRMTIDSAGLVTIPGDLTVNGTTTTINSTTLVVQDKNIEMGVVATPTDVTADGGGITLKGTTDKTINWIDATDAWTFSEHVNIASAKEYRIAGTKVLDATSLGSAVVGSSLTSVGTIGTGVWQGTAIADIYLGTISTALKVSNSATTATSANTASAIVARDASGNFTAGTITANLTGTASNVTTNANLTGDITSVGNATTIAAGVIVDADINASAAIVDTKLATIATAGKVSNSATTATDANTASAIVARDASGNFTAGTITATLTGNAATVTTNANLTGDITSVGNATTIAAGVIVNADVNASAAIAGTKVAPDFGSQTVITTGSALIGTATSLSTLYSGAGKLQAASNDATTIQSYAFSSTGVDYSATLELSRARNTQASPAIVVNGDYIGQINFAGYNTNFQRGATIYALVDGEPGTAGDTTDMPGKLVFATTPNGSATPTTRMSIDSAGAVTLAGTLDVPLGAAATPSISFTGDTNTGIYSPGADQLAVATNGTGRVFVDANGNIGLGITPVANTLIGGARGSSLPGLIELAGNGNTVGSSGFAIGQDSSGVGVLFQRANAAMYFATNGAERLRITSTGALNFVGAGTAGSTQAVSFNGSAPVDSLVVDSSGRLGIGTSSVSNKLHLSTTGTDGFRLAVDGQTYYNMIRPNGDGLYIGTDDGNTGGSGADIRFNIKATEKMRLTSTGLGIGITGPQAPLHVRATAGAANDRGILIQDTTTGTAGEAWLSFKTQESTDEERVKGAIVYANAGSAVGRGNLLFLLDSVDDNGSVTTSDEKIRITYDGKLLVGTSSSTGNIREGQLFSVTAQNSGYGGMSLGCYNSGSVAPIFDFNTSASSSSGNYTAVANNRPLGYIVFRGSDGSQFVESATIKAEVDGAPGANDMPGRLVFSVTRDGSASPTEAARINNAGYSKFTNTGGYVEGGTFSYHEFYRSGSGLGLVVTGADASYASVVNYIQCSRAASNAYSLLSAYSSTGGDREFNLQGDGNGLCDGAWTGGGADYAEYFEWSDGNTDAEDRRGISVVLDGDKIRETVAGEDPIGVISGNPSVVGDSAWNKWSGKYLRDEFGTYIQEDYEVTDEDGNTVVQQRRKLNPAYDPAAEYIPREQRPEWDCVGLMGKLRIRKGQVTGSRWIKMRDISDTVEEWLVR